MVNAKEGAGMDTGKDVQRASTDDVAVAADVRNGRTDMTELLSEESSVMKTIKKNPSIESLSIQYLSGRLAAEIVQLHRGPLTLTIETADQSALALLRQHKGAVKIEAGSHEDEQRLQLTPGMVELLSDLPFIKVERASGSRTKEKNKSRRGDVSKTNAAKFVIQAI